jgi:hypothetical protein
MLTEREQELLATIQQMAAEIEWLGQMNELLRDDNKRLTQTVNKMARRRAQELRGNTAYELTEQPQAEGGQP